MKVVCDDVTTIFVDGEEKAAVGTGAWDQVATVQIPVSTKVVGIQCKNNGGPYGIMAEVVDSSGEVVTVTDESWRCSNQIDDGWSNSGFSAGVGWELAAYNTRHPNYNIDTGAWKGMSPAKKVIWTGSAADVTVYCRKDMSKPLGEYHSLHS